MLKESLRKAIEEAIKSFKEDFGGEELPSILIETPKEEKFGHFSTNIALLLSSRLAKPPRKIAEEILKKFNCTIVEKAEIAGPGFINFFITQKTWQDLVPEVLAKRERYGSSDLGRGEKIQIEFVSANPTGPLHIGHGRGAAVGDVLANILEFSGFDVHREYYINDVGVQMTTLGKSLKARYLELLGEEVKFPENGYPGGYLKDVAKELYEEVGDSLKDKGQGAKGKGVAAGLSLREEAEKADSRELIAESLQEGDLEFFIKFACEKLLNLIKKDLEDFRVRFDAWFSEVTLFESGEIKNSIELLKSKGIIYEKDGAWWLRSSGSGDEKDRVVIKTDGATTYLASDIAYHKNKFERGYKKVIDIWGADHHGYIPRMKSVVQSLGYPKDSLIVILVQIVNLQKHGKTVAMGKREGQFVTLREVMDEVGVDACRFFFLERKSDAHLSFDLELAKEHSSKNPVYYVQYGHARICSIFRKAQEKGLNLQRIDKVDLSLLKIEEELSLIRKIYQFQETIEAIANSFEPHHITFYLKELVTLFHKYYNEHPVLGNDVSLSSARLNLCKAVNIVLENGLRLLGISAPESM
ncbi:MAG: arginine--tRNA ligase [Candidatus Schekmanbacteria bacterium GWA2_38_11]|uniref:Arginine--tRNA ligase n=1 Tax=Candidatus Schekmanbacteria bacterium GWA2_38_11 TaxID=1817876 RepID=A0A1F7RPY5_9BACT|nr:MAG: arginine--tRNA ligase [Candidatus Schekmanbacteria bacterium GWA2_38_11]